FTLATLSVLAIIASVAVAAPVDDSPVAVAALICPPIDCPQVYCNCGETPPPKCGCPQCVPCP
ncbi:hypothetical protein BGZ76_000806, partial [Entomortierella beljakovae]